MSYQRDQNALYSSQTIARPFNEAHLDNIIGKLKMGDHVDKKVKEFLVDMGNEFLEKVAKKSLSLGRKKKKFDSSHVRFVMRNVYNIELGRIPAEDQKK